MNHKLKSAGSPSAFLIRVGNGTGVTGLSWLFGDHLGSTSLAVVMSAIRTGEQEN